MRAKNLKLTEVVFMYQVATTVANEFNLEYKDIKQKTKREDIVKPRQIAMYLIDRHFPFTRTAIGDFFGKNNETVLWAVQIVSTMKKLKDRKYYQKIKILDAKVKDLSKSDYHNIAQL